MSEDGNQSTEFSNDVDTRMMYTQSTTFDMDGDGVDEGVAYLGWGGSLNDVNWMYVWYYNTKTKESGGLKAVGDGFKTPYKAWKGVDDIDYVYRAQSFFSITSGDYDGDGADSIVVAFNSESNDANRPVVVEMEWNAANKSFDEIASKFALTEYTNSAYQTSGIRTSSSYYDLLSIQLATGDINNDGIDDLISLAYTNDTSNTYRNQSSANLYTPHNATKSNVVPVYGYGISSITANHKRIEDISFEKQSNGDLVISWSAPTGNGQSINLAANGDGTYSFLMPDSAVDINAEFENTTAEQYKEIAAKTFSDVDAGRWYSSAVGYCTNNGILSGYTDGTFRPGENATKIGVIAALARYSGSSISGGKGSTWYEPYVNWAKENNISDGTDLDKDITREQLVLMMWNLSGKPESDYAISFKDTSSVDSWAVTAVRWAVERGIISGKTGNNIDPLGTATRAELAQIIYNFSKLNVR